MVFQANHPEILVTLLYDIYPLNDLEREYILLVAKYRPNMANPSVIF